MSEGSKTMKRFVLALFAVALLCANSAFAQNKKPNILVIMGDDIGWFNPSCYHSGIMGYQTPNIDRIAKEGARFTDWYGQQSCTAGRAAFICSDLPAVTTNRPEFWRWVGDRRWRCSRPMDNVSS